MYQQWNSYACPGHTKNFQIYFKKHQILQFAMFHKTKLMQAPCTNKNLFIAAFLYKKKTTYRLHNSFSVFVSLPEILHFH